MLRLENGAMILALKHFSFRTVVHLPEFLSFWAWDVLNEKGDGAHEMAS